MNGKKVEQLNVNSNELEEEQLLNTLKSSPKLIRDTSCGIGFLRGPNLQRFANKKAYVFLYGLLGCIFTASYAYFNGTITTIEKRFKIPSKTTGLITVGNDISQLFISVFLSYYAGRGHRPRWIAVGIYTVVIFCLLTMLPHFLYGPGEDALRLTKEYEDKVIPSNKTLSIINNYHNLEPKETKFLCHDDKNDTIGNQCEKADGNLAPQILLFVAQLVSGVGGSLYYTLGTSYMDDNIQKSKTPALISYSYFLRMLGPAIGYSLASVSLKFYISPTLTPTITNKDPRWIGAWWMGFGILALVLFIFASIIGLFPKTLPRAAARKALALQRSKPPLSNCADNNINNSQKGSKLVQEQDFYLEQSHGSPSISDMIKTFKRLFTNSALMSNSLANVFYFLGYMPYWIFMPKYIETQYRQSASVSSLITGTVGLVFSAFGILLSGLIISKYRPKARFLAGWNVFVGALSCIGMISYAFLGCTANDQSNVLNVSGQLKTEFDCNSNCNCDFVTYSPVCSEEGKTFISACHAGCQDVFIYPNGTKIYTNCLCVKGNKAVGNETADDLGIVTAGACSVDCYSKFYIFLTVVCLLKFSGATGRASNFLVSVRCVEEKDKTVAMGFSLTLMSLFAFIPSPILFGFILDKTCLVWGKTCSGTGNCWLYNGEALRYLLNFTAAGFVLIGTLFDAGVWYYVKDVKIFDDEIEIEDIVEEPTEPM